MRFSTVAIAAATLLLFAPIAKAEPVTVDQGFNVAGQNILQFVVGADSGVSSVPGVAYGGAGVPNDNAGTILKGFSLIPLGLANNNFSFTFDAASVFGLAATGQTNVESATLFIDLEGFGGGDSVSVNINGEQVTGFLTGSGNLAIALTGAWLNGPNGLQNDTSFTVSLTRGGGVFLVDGFNVQAVLNPEPASMLAWGLVVGAGAVGYRLRKRKVAIA